MVNTFENLGSGIIPCSFRRGHRLPEGCRPLFPAVTFCENAYAVAEGADALIIATEWNQFRKLELDRLHQLLRHPLILDFRNLYEPDTMAAAGFDYISIGRPEGHGATGSATTPKATDPLGARS